MSSLMAKMDIRTIGISRAKVKIGMANIAYNMPRYVWLTGKARTASCAAGRKAKMYAADAEIITRNGGHPREFISEMHPRDHCSNRDR